MREIRFTISKIEKIILVQIVLLGITSFILGGIEANYPPSEGSAWIFRVIGILMISVVILRVFASINSTTYIDEGTIIQKSKLPKRSTKIQIEDITNIRFEKLSIKIQYRIDEKEPILLIPRAKGMDLDDYRQLLKVLNKSEDDDPYMITDNGQSQKSVAKGFIIFLLITQFLAFLGVLSHPAG